MKQGRIFQHLGALVLMPAATPLFACDDDDASSDSDCDLSQAPTHVHDRDSAEAFWQDLNPGIVDWAEFFPSVRELAGSADLAVVGRFVDASDSIVVVDEHEDFYGEVKLVIEVTEVLGGNRMPSDGRVYVRFPAASAGDAEGLDAARCRLRSGLPADEFVFLLRTRSDDPEAMRIVNGYGIIGPRAGVELDTVIQPGALTGDGIYAAELSGVGSVAMLVEYLRSPVP